MVPSPARFLSWSVASLAVAALVMVVLTTTLRTRSALAVIDISPGVNVTSGCEDESLHLLWRQAHGDPVYIDSSRPPFSAAYFNWLFYRSYGVVTPDSPAPGDVHALIRNARLLTLAGALCGTFALCLFAARLAPGQPAAHRLAAFALAAWVFLGPLTGWWIVTTRPDLWALAFECGGLLVVLSLWRRTPLTAALLAAVCFYAAWAFKQNFIQGLGCALLFLVVNRQWKSASLLLGLSVAGWSATAFVLGPEYRAALLSTVTSSGFSLAVGWDNFLGAVVRALPLILAAACLPFQPAPHGESTLARDSLRLAVIALPLSLAFSFATSCKLGAASNYYLTSTVFVGLLALVSLSRATTRPVFSGVPLLALIALSAGLLVTNKLQLRPHIIATTSDRWAVWENAPSPRYAHDQLLNLPWLNPGAPVYLTAFNYDDERAAGRSFAHDGIGGLIREGYFASLLLPDSVTDTYDHAPLHRYERGVSVAGLTLWSLTPPPSNP
jgi:hypothetical protein